MSRVTILVSEKVLSTLELIEAAIMLQHYTRPRVESERLSRLESQKKFVAATPIR